MAFAEWTSVTTNASAVTRIFTGVPRTAPMGFVTQSPSDTPALSAPMHGSGSLLMHCLSSNLRCQTWRTRAEERGWMAGRLQTLVTVPAGHGAGIAFGLYCLANQERLLDGTGRAIVLSCQNVSLNRCELGLVTQGLLNTYNIPGVDSANNQWAQGQTIAMELAWEHMAGDCTVTYRQGTQTDFSNLALVLTYSGAAPDAMGSYGEGLWGATMTHAGLKVYWDQTTITPI